MSSEQTITDKSSITSTSTTTLKTEPKTESKSKMPTTFLSLPAELRNRIYFLSTDLVPTAFLPPVNLTSNPPSNENFSRSIFLSGYELKLSRIYIDCTCRGCWSKLTQPSLTRVSRQIRSETLSIFYGSNKYYINTERIGRWLKAIEGHLGLFEEVKLGPRCKSAEMVNFLLDLDLKVELQVFLVGK